jgi:hypothetical protein
MSKPNNSKREQYTQKIDPKETGTWVSGITNSEIATLFGTLMSDWVHIEEAMVDLMDILVLPDVDLRLAAGQKARGFLPGQQIFRSMSANGVTPVQTASQEAWPEAEPLGWNNSLR